MKALSNILSVWRRIPLWGRIILGVAIIVLMIWVAIPNGTPDVLTAVVQQGEFVIDIKETGHLRAENSVTVSAPPIRMSLQIVYLCDEGIVVEQGDTLIQLDTTEIKQQIDDGQAELDIVRSNLESSLVSMASRMSNLEASLENSQASYRLAELRREQMRFESDVQIEEGELNLLQAEISLRRAREDITAQKQIDSSEVRSLTLRIRQADIELEKAFHDMRRLTLTAPAPGLVVHMKTWKGSEWAKVKVGDTPWRGMALIELPDLSVMMVETTVSEVDVGKVEVGQEVEIKLDAYPDPTFHGKIAEVAVLAGEREDGPGAQVFDVLIRIDESDPVLRPGMSTTAKIIIDRLPNKIWVPIESVFQDNDTTIVWEADGSDWIRREVGLGARNDNFVVIESGLEAGGRVALVDPTIATREEVKPKQTDNPDENQSDQQSSSSRGGRRQRG